MFEIPVGEGKFAIVDDLDMDLALCHSWSVNRDRRGVATGVQGWYKGKPSQLSRVIADRIGLSLESDIDHKDTDFLNNRRDNLRPASKSQNSANRGANANNKLGVKGVCFQKGKYVAKLGKKPLGRFDTIEEAAEAYMMAAKSKYGEFARS